MGEKYLVTLVFEIYADSAAEALAKGLAVSVLDPIEIHCHKPEDV
jgi:hypothetical protein